MVGGLWPVQAWSSSTTVAKRRQPVHVLRVRDLHPPHMDQMRPRRRRVDGDAAFNLPVHLVVPGRPLHLARELHQHHRTLTRAPPRAGRSPPRSAARSRRRCIGRTGACPDSGPGQAWAHDAGRPCGGQPTASRPRTGACRYRSLRRLQAVVRTRLVGRLRLLRPVNVVAAVRRSTAVRGPGADQTLVPHVCPTLPGLGLATSRSPSCRPPRP
jgi:hypothetical protein